MNLIREKDFVKFEEKKMILNNQYGNITKATFIRRKKYFQSVFSWLSTSVILFGINMVTNHHVHWWKSVFFFWGIAILFKTISLIKHELWNEEDEMQYNKNRRRQLIREENENIPLDLNQPKKEKETIKKYWNSKDFV